MKLIIMANALIFEMWGAFSLGHWLGFSATMPWRWWELPYAITCVAIMVTTGYFLDTRLAKTKEINPKTMKPKRIWEQ